MRDANQKRITPLKVVLIYLLAFGIVSVHEIDRVVTWVERGCLHWESASTVLAYCDRVRDAARVLKLDALSDAEEGVIQYATGRRPSVASPDSMMDEEPAEETAANDVEPPLEPEAVPLLSGTSSVSSESHDGPTVKTGPASGFPQAWPDVPPETPPETGSPMPSIQAAAVSESVETQPDQPTTPPGPLRLAPRKVLIAGDSTVLEGFGVALQRELKTHPELTVIREGTYSSGLVRPDYFDWMPYLASLIEQHKPDVLFVSLGANDPQDILDEDRNRHFAMTDGWNEIYAARVREFLNIADRNNLVTFWVGLPVMDNPNYGRKIANINSVVEKVCAEFPACHFVDTWRLLADDEGQYQRYARNDDGKPVRVRAKDGIHLTEDGGRIVAHYLLDATSSYVRWPWEAAEATPAADATPDTSGTTPSGESVGPPPDGGEVRLLSFYSEARGKKTSYYAFVPGTTSDSRRFPVVYLLHGAWDGYQAWKDRAGDLLVDLAQKHQIVLVTPDGDEFGWYADSEILPTSRIETFFIGELMPHVEANLPVMPDRRGIAGLSMGGHGAFVLTLRHPGTFATVSSMSGILDITRHPDQWQIDRVLGPYSGGNIERWNGYSAYELCRNHPDVLRGMSILVSASIGDPWALEDNRRFRRLLNELGISHEYQEAPGGHDWTFWRSELPRHIEFHARNLAKN